MREFLERRELNMMVWLLQSKGLQRPATSAPSTGVSVNCSTSDLMIIVVL